MTPRAVREAVLNCRDRVEQRMCGVDIAHKSGTQQGGVNMRLAPIALLFLLPVLGCPKSSPSGPPKGVSETQAAFETWVFAQIDERTWHGCSRNAVVDLRDFEVVFPIGENGDGDAGVAHFEPRGAKSDPGMMCLALELIHPPEFPAPGAPTNLRLPLARVAAQATGG